MSSLFLRTLFSICTAQSEIGCTQNIREKMDNNLEHFLIPDTRSKYVTWIDAENTFELALLPSIVISYKKYHINYLIINEGFNGDMGHNDVIDKIIKITL